MYRMQGSYVSVGDLRLYYQDCGPEDHAAQRPPMVLLHGFTLDHRMWEETAKHFSKRHRVIVLDARGHGLSDSPPTGYSRVDRVDDLVAVIDALGLSRFHLIGLSMGGSTAIGYALRDRSCLASLTLVSTGAAGWNLGKKIGRIDQIAQEQGLEAARSAWMDYALRYYDVNRTDHRRIRGLLEAMMREHSGAPWMDERRGKYPPPGNDLDHVHKIEVPTLIIAGAKDKVWVPLAQALAERITGSRLLVYPDIGHMVNLEAGDVFNCDLQGFLDSIDLVGDSE